MSVAYKFKPRGATAGWQSLYGPIMPKGFRFCQDCCVIKENDTYRMWFSWTDPRLIAHCTSLDGLHWSYPTVVLPAVTGSVWEGHEVSRPWVIRQAGKYHMWYTATMHATEFNPASSSIGYAVSDDGFHWERRSEPVMRAEQAWEGRGLTYANVMWDEAEGLFKMWFAGGEIREADAIGYATSRDGIHWTRFGQNPIFCHRDGRYFEVYKVTDPCVIRQGDWYYMFYMGVDGDGISCAGLARSRDGVTNWVRHPSNPVYAATDGTWDWIGVRGLSILAEDDRIRMWYTGVDRTLRTLGMIEHPGIDLSFDAQAPDERGFGECHGEPNQRVNTCILRF